MMTEKTTGFGAPDRNNSISVASSYIDFDDASIQGSAITGLSRLFDQGGFGSTSHKEVIAAFITKKLRV